MITVTVKVFLPELHCSGFGVTFNGVLFFFFNLFIDGNNAVAFPTKVDGSRIKKTGTFKVH